MTEPSFATTFEVDATPQAAFAAITDVRGWWSEDIVGATDVLGAEFDYRYKDVHSCRIRVTELVPGERVAWLILENRFSFTEDKTEWTGTRVIFDIARKGDRTELRLTHQGLVPSYECYDICTDGWSTYFNGSLRALIETGTGNPNLGDPMTDSERVLTA
jgi:hypothetical protein